MRRDLIPDWGFSCLVEAHGKTILFDTGAHGYILLENMKTLGIDPLSIDEVFLSHPHFDHTGGLSDFMRYNSRAVIFAPYCLAEGSNNDKIIFVREPLKLHDHIFSTGELDDFEQSMVVETDKGLVIVTGCSHPAMQDIFSAASRFGKIYGIVGGLHDFSDFELFRDLGMICPTHCTRYLAALKMHYPNTYIQGGAGVVIEV